MPNSTQIQIRNTGRPPEYSSANTQAIISLILGILSLLGWFTPIGCIAGMICGIIAIILARLARKRLRSEDRSIATIGFVCAVLGLSISAFVLLFLFGIFGFLVYIFVILAILVETFIPFHIW